MFALISQNGMLYTGRAGEGWLSRDKAEAFLYSTEGEAIRKAASFNRNFDLHGEMFQAVEEDDILTFFEKVVY